jgi:hypothetical protein
MKSTTPPPHPSRILDLQSQDLRHVVDRFVQTAQDCVDEAALMYQMLGVCLAEVERISGHRFPDQMLFPQDLALVERRLALLGEVVGAAKLWAASDHGNQPGNQHAAQRLLQAISLLDSTE